MPCRVGGDVAIERGDGRVDRCRVDLAGSRVAHPGVDVEHHRGLPARLPAPAVAPDRVRNLPLPLERHRRTGPVAKQSSRSRAVAVATRRVPEAEVETERVRRARNDTAVVAEPANAVAIGLVEANAERPAGIAARIRTRIVWIRRRRGGRDRRRGERHDDPDSDSSANGRAHHLDRFGGAARTPPTARSSELSVLFGYRGREGAITRTRAAEGRLRAARRRPPARARPLGSAARHPRRRHPGRVRRTRAAMRTAPGATRAAPRRGRARATAAAPARTAPAAHRRVLGIHSAGSRSSTSRSQRRLRSVVERQHCAIPSSVFSTEEDPRRPISGASTPGTVVPAPPRDDPRALTPLERGTHAPPSPGGMPRDRRTERAQPASSSSSSSRSSAPAVEERRRKCRCTMRNGSRLAPSPRTAGEELAAAALERVVGERDVLERRDSGRRDSIDRRNSSHATGRRTASAAPCPRRPAAGRVPPARDPACVAHRCVAKRSRREGLDRIALHGAADSGRPPGSVGSAGTDG